MDPKNTIWVEKYRPQSIDEMILPDTVKNIVSGGVNNHLLFHGSAGLGKTSLAKILAKDRSSMYINCSVETGVDTVRTKITDFCSSIGISFTKNERKEKIVILDEFDGVSDAYMKAMRGTIEQFAHTTKFIATCNFINKIPDYMQSRFNCIDFNFQSDELLDLKKQYVVRLHKIAGNEGLKIEPKAIAAIVRTYFPDLRKTISFLQRMKDEGKINITEADINSFSGEYKELYQLFFNSAKYFDIYTYIYKNYSGNEDDVFAALGRDFVKYIEKEQPSKIGLIGPIITYAAEWSYKSQFCIDPLSPLAACIHNIHALTSK